jgi:hypothetical protein
MIGRNVTKSFALFVAASLAAAGATAREPVVDPQSESGLDYYAQGGVVVGGTGYFTSDDGCRRPGAKKSVGFPSVVAFDLETGRKLRTYPFARTYDSAPLVVQRKDGAWLVIAHEHERARTVAVHRDTGKVEWISSANQPGFYFFGYSYFERPDRSKLILMAAPTGLHALSSETGEEVWTLAARSSGGVTPCVDQKRGWVFYQTTGKLWKLHANDGQILKSVSVPRPNTCISWNTALVDDEHGRFVATRWYGKPEWDSALRVYDPDLNLIWEKTGLPSGKKDVLTYAEGKLVTGAGNGWSSKYTDDRWKQIVAYRIADGTTAWKCELSEHEIGCIPNVPYFNGCFYAESQGSPPVSGKLFRIRASDGLLLETLDHGRAITSCAPSIIARGRLLSGDLWQDRIVVTQLARGAKADWPGPFGDPQLNHYAAPPDPAAQPVPLKELVTIK